MIESCTVRVTVILVLSSLVTGIPTSPTTREDETQLKRVPKQVGVSPGASVSTTKDHAGAETYGHGHGHGFGHGMEHGHHGHGHDGKYFMYANNPAYNEYEFGYRRGNDYHFQERYEKAHDWNFKTKVKWGDKHGGYGEHYWDYNHADKGHGHDGGHGHGHGHEGGHGHESYGHYSEPVPSYEGTHGGVDPRNRERNHKPPAVNKRESKRNQNQATKNKGENSELLTSASARIPRLSLDRVTGKVTDETSGKTYYLQPTN